MRYLNKIIFINSAHVPYAEIKLDGNVHFIGTQGVGKSTLLRAILFFYNADKLRLGIPKEKKGFDAFYFPYDNSYIVYEVMRENGAYCVLVMKSMKRAAYRFIDAPYSREWFMNDRNEVVSDWIEIRKKLPLNCAISSLINDYYIFRDIIFGNNRNNELLPYRKYAIVESSNYQNIPRTIQNVFLNSKLDADFIKDTIIKSMNEDDVSLDLNVYRSLISTFEQEYTDVMLWLKPNKNGVIEVRKQADNVIKKYRQLLYLKQQIKQERSELNYAEREAIQNLPILEEEINNLLEKQNRFIRLLEEEDDKFKKEHDKLTKEEGVYEEKLKASRLKKKEYERLNIAQIIDRVERESDINTELESTSQSLVQLTSLYNDIISKYNELTRHLDADLKDFENQKREDVLKVKENFTEVISFLTSLYTEREKDERDRIDVNKERLHAEILDMNNEKIGLSSQLNMVRMNLHFKDEIEQTMSDIEKLKGEQGRLSLAIDQSKLDIKRLRQDTNNELNQINGKFEKEIAEAQQKRDVLDREIGRLNLMLEQQKGSFCEWLDKNRSGWQQTIGKVVDEESILYNQHLNPKIISDNSQSLFGVSIDISNIDRKLYTPEVIKDEINQKNLEREKLSGELVKLNTILSEEQTIVTKKANTKIREHTEHQNLLESKLERIPSSIKKLQVEFSDWNRKEDEWKTSELNRINLLLGENENKQRQLKSQLDQLKIELQKKLKQLSEERKKEIKGKELIRDEKIAQLTQQVSERKNDIEKQKKELLASQTNELNGRGADTSVINNYRQKKVELSKELDFIRENRHVVFEYEKDKREYFDLELSFQNKKKEIVLQLAELKEKYEQRAEKLKNNKNEIKVELDAKCNEKNTINKDIESLRMFKEDPYFCPIESSTIEECETRESCGKLVELLKREILNCVTENDSFKKSVNAFSGNFTAQNTFSFPTTPITDEDYSNYAANVCEFVEENKIAMYQTRISERYSNIIRRISKEIGELTKNDSEIQKTIKAINNDFVERNFTGVIRSIELRAQPTNDKLMQLLLEIKQFNEENQFNMGEVDLFSQESRSDVNEKAVKYLNSLRVKLNDDPSRKSIVLSDTFNLQFRIVENDNDTGWIEKIANVGSDGTDILVKAMVNIMLINVFKEKASRRFGDFKLHCMMDEIGKLHPTNVKGILSFANSRNILLINSSPTTYNVEDYRYTYLLSKDAQSNTKVVPLLTRNK